MSGALFTFPKAVALGNGTFLPNAQLRFFLTGTTTPTDSYSDITLDTEHSIPVVASADGVFEPIYLSPYITYRVRLSDSSGTQIYQVDDIAIGTSESSVYRVKHTAPYVILEETDASANNGKWRISVNNEALKVELGNDAESVFNSVLTVDSRSGVTVADAVVTIHAPTVLAGATTTISGIVSASGGFETGSFTPSYGGFSADPTGDITWVKTGDLVTLLFDSANTGTSDDTAFNLTSLPAAIRPSTDNEARHPCIVIDNGAVVPGAFGFTVAGRLDFFTDSPLSAAGFTNSGTKGLPAFATLTYFIH